MTAIKNKVQGDAPDNNILLGKGVMLVLDDKRKKDIKNENKRNKNVLVIGGSGTGKTFRYVKPNIGQMNASFVVTDPSGEILMCCGRMLAENGYKIKVFSVSDMKHSDCYNPLDYIYDENGEVDQSKVKILVSTFINNAQGLQGGAKGGDPFWTKSSEAWMTFAVLYLAECRPPEDRDMAHVLKLAQLGKADEESSSSLSVLDKLVNMVKEETPNAKCLASYDTFALAPAKTRNSILISIAVDLNQFSIDDVRDMTTTSYVCKRDRKGLIKEYLRDHDGKLIRDSNNIDLDKVGDEKTALFINTPQANSAFDFLIAMMYSQLFNTLYTKAEKISPNRWHIYDNTGFVLSSQYMSEKAAEEALNLFKNADIVEEEQGGETFYYIFNPEAGMEYTQVPEKAAAGKYGYMKQVFSKEMGKRIIESYRSAKVVKGGLRLPIHVRFILDEFKNTGRIPDFERLLATMRKYEMSANVILQSLSQLKAMYRDSWEELVGNCDTKVLLGSSELDTNKYVSELLGKSTITTINHSESKSGVSSSQQRMGRELMTPAELALADNTKEIVIVRGVKPFWVPKLSWLEHPSFSQCGDADPAKAYGLDCLEKYHKCLPKASFIGAKVADVEKNKATVMKKRIVPDGRGVKATPRIMNVRNEKELSNALSSDPEEVEEVLKNTPSVPEGDFSPTTSAVLKKDKSTASVISENTESSTNDIEIPDSALQEEEGSAKTGETSAAADTAAATAPGSLTGAKAEVPEDESWIFEG